MFSSPYYQPAFTAATNLNEGVNFASYPGIEMQIAILKQWYILKEEVVNNKDVSYQSQYPQSKRLSTGLHTPVEKVFFLNLKKTKLHFKVMAAFIILVYKFYQILLQGTLLFYKLFNR